MSVSDYYDGAAKRYDRLRRFSPRAAVLLKRAVKTVPEGPVLDLGCGTGNLTRALLRLFPDRMTVGVDLSLGMLARAREKSRRISLVRADALNLPFPPRTFALAAGAYFIHHVEDWTRVIREIRRVLRPNGTAALYTSSQYRIAKHFANRFFPSFGKVDADRFPALSALSEALSSAGFRDIRVTHVSVGLRRIDRDLLEKARRRFMSTFDLIPENEFTAGIEKMKRHVLQRLHPRRYRHMGVLVTASKTASSTP